MTWGEYMQAHIAACEQQAQRSNAQDREKEASKHWCPMRRAGEQAIRALEQRITGLYLTQHEAVAAVEAWRKVVPLPPELEQLPERLA